MAVPTKFRKSAEGAIASYDFVDIAEGTGIVVFNGFTQNNSGALAYALTRNSPHSNEVNTNFSADDAAYTKRIDADFDVVFNRPERVKGKMYVTLTLGAGEETTANRRCDMFFVARLRKVSGGIETEVAIGQSEKLTGWGSDASAAVDYKTLSIEVDIATMERYRKDDTLRVTIEVWAKISNGNAVVYLLHDPKDRTDDDSAPVGGSQTTLLPATSIMSVFIPFILDL
tara:strand:+ start:664 stop:1347 length:684 start_codon:yes stop_codon:yes gene_type:complete